MSTPLQANQLRSEYPRPQFQRDTWLNLNGAWNFRFDDANEGLSQHWYEQSRVSFDNIINVPFTFESELSGIGDTGFHDTVWYHRTFPVPASFGNHRVVLHFGAVDYEAMVWVNGQMMATHQGGYTPFAVDITDVLQASGDNDVVVRVHDPSRDLALPRGKQYWQEQSESIFYTRTTGIWQTVWLEAVSSTHLKHVRFTPNVAFEEVRIDTRLNDLPNHQRVTIRVRITYGAELIDEVSFECKGSEASHVMDLGHTAHKLHGKRHWSPENPQLFEASLCVLVDGVEMDSVKSYFGLRSVEIDNGQFYLNGHPYEMKLVLNQGYFPTGILTAPSDADIKRDVELIKEMGFNGVRMHQKVEDPRFLYWCDKLGLIVWGEAPNAYVYTDGYVERFTKEWMDIVTRDYNHPCIVAWVPLNESWGVPEIRTSVAQQHHARAMYHLTKSIDTTRPVMSNDGWEHVESDFCTIHDYEWRRDVLADRYKDAASATKSMPARRKIFVGGALYHGEPILVTEFGGIAYKKSDWEGWGYSGASSDEDFITRLRDVFDPLHDSPVVAGYCYTQFTDVEQEINGLLTYDRRPKVPLEEIRKINRA